MAVYLLNATSYLYDFIPRQIYEHCLLRIPRLYFLRVTRTFEDLQLTRRDITRMADARADEWDSSANHNLSPGLLRFRSSWEDLIDSLMREWKTLNIISVLLMSTILSMLQIDAASHPITRTTALFSLICALMSLLYGCMYIVRFGRMRKMHKANRFAEEARKTKTKIWWNVWVVLAMPAVWLAWSIITFLTCIMSFIWLGAFSNDLVHSDVSPRVVLGLRIALTAVFSIGVFCFFLIIRTFQRFRDE
ncbi:hypothetical protein B0H16DRAFT_1316900 [Mycena metata]|uniref:Uncharacterized protein n=1 Tax=Mycena metata TaxID=1033252 RepID=A0AAD7NBP2_9AGAR|nr:hypothetical protein B0H16DRAFT_1316900 [Mycena metata]